MISKTSCPFISEGHIPVLNATAKAHLNGEIQSLVNLYQEAKFALGDETYINRRSGKISLRRVKDGKGAFVTATDMDTGLFLQLANHDLSQINVVMTVGRLYVAETHDQVRHHSSTKVWSNV